jgi:hypothetical protein
MQLSQCQIPQKYILILGFCSPKSRTGIIDHLPHDNSKPKMPYSKKKPPQLLGLPSQPRHSRVIRSEGPLDEEAPFDFTRCPKYEYLPIQAHQIRLITLRGGRSQAPLRCRLEALGFAKVRERKNYSALSYSCKHLPSCDIIRCGISHPNGFNSESLMSFRGKRKRSSPHPHGRGQWFGATTSCETEPLSSIASTTSRTQRRRPTLG